MWAIVLLLLWSGILPRSLATLVNRTIDDTKGDSVTGRLPVYFPQSGLWNAGQNCTGCAAKVDPSQAFDGTWHDVEYNLGLNVTTQPTVTLNFNGSAIYVFCILENTNTPATLLGFTLDGTSKDPFQHIPVPNTLPSYNQSVFSENGLEAGEHTLVVSLLKDTVDKTNNTLLLFDYAVYTVDEDDASPSSPSSSPQSSPSSHKSTPVGAIAGGVVGGVAALTLLAALLFFLRRRSRARNAQLLPHPLVAHSANTPTEKDIVLASPRAEGAIDPYTTQTQVPVLTGAYPVPPSDSVGGVSSSDSVRGTTAVAVTGSATSRSQNTSEKRDLLTSPSSVAPASSLLTLPTSATTDGPASRAAVDAASASSPDSSGAPFIGPTTDPEAREQIQSLWQEVRMLRAQQEMQVSGEPLPEYFSASSEDGT